MKQIRACLFASILAALSLALTSVAGETKFVCRVSVDDFEKLSQTKTNVALDVRTEKEFTAGHIAGAKKPGF